MRIISLCLLFVLVFISAKTTTIVDQSYEYGSFVVEDLENLYKNQLVRKAEYELLDFSKNARFYPAKDKQIILQSDIDITSGNYSIADGRLSEFIIQRDNSPLVPHASLMRALIKFQDENYDRSAALFDYSFKQAQEDFEVRNDSIYHEIAYKSIFWKAVSLTYQGKHQEAIETFQQFVEDYKNTEYTDDAYYNLGRIYEMNRDYEPAIDNYSKLRKLFPESELFVIGNIRLANNYLILRNPSASIAVLGEAENKLNTKQELVFREQAPEMILYLKGETQNLAGNYSQAHSYFQEFNEKYSKSDFINRVNVGSGWALINLEEYDQAIEDFDKVIYSDEAAFTEKSTAQLYRTIALKKRGDVDQARRELSALVVQPTYPFLGQALLEIGQIYYEENEFEMARRTLERADRETLDAKIAVRVNLLLGATYLEMGLWDKAVNEYKKAELSAENGSDIFMPKKKWYLAEARLKQGIALVKNLRSREAFEPLTKYISDEKNKDREDVALFWLAEAYYTSDLLENAVETYQKLLDKYPNTLRREDALYGLGWTYFRQQNFNQSTRIFNQMIEEYPKSKYNIEVLTRQGDGYYLKKNYSKAAEFYRRASEMAPGTEEGQYSAYQLSHALYRQGSYEQAITSSLNFYSMYSKSPYAPNTLYLVGWIKFQQNKFGESIDNFRFLLSAYPQSGLVPRAHYAIGDCYYNMSEFEKAIESYKTVVEEFPSSSLAPEAFKSIQFCLIALGRDDEAIEILDNYITSNDESPFVEEFRFKKGEMFYQGRKYEDAINEYDDFLEEHPSSDKASEVLFWKGKSYANLNETDKAFETYEKLYKEFPDSDYAPLSILESAILNMEMANIEQADSLFVFLQRKYPKHQSAAQAGYERAMIRYIVGDTTDAMNIFREVADEYRNTDYGDQSRYRLAMYFRNKGMNDSARANFAVIAKVYENPIIAAEAQYRIGELYMRDTTYPMAVEAFEIVKEKFTGVEDWYSLSLLGLGEAYEALDEFDKARAIYEQLEEWRPEDDFGKTAKRRLKRVEDR